VAEAAVVGTRNELGHDELVAHLVLKQDAVIDPAAFFNFCNREMPYFMVPRFLVLQHELPKTATLRIEKYKLQQPLPPGAIDRKQLGIELKR
jgi:crotonobetaine/carnitine-CoA ligase